MNCQQWVISMVKNNVTKQPKVKWIMLKRVLLLVMLVILVRELTHM